MNRFASQIRAEFFFGIGLSRPNAHAIVTGITGGALTAVEWFAITHRGRLPFGASMSLGVREAERDRRRYGR